VVIRKMSRGEWGLFKRLESRGRLSGEVNGGGRGGMEEELWWKGGV
jgi:hypothetical protein